MVEKKKIAIVAMGPSCAAWLTEANSKGSPHAYYDEVWGINSAGCSLVCDKIFHMDDLEVQERRAEKNPFIRGMLKKFRKPEGPPIITSRRLERYPRAVEFPLQETLQYYNTNGYFNSTVAYALALAPIMGADTIGLYGADFTYPQRAKAEKGRACVEWWLGLIMNMGLRLIIPKNSSLMDLAEGQPFYGYDAYDVEKQADGTLKKNPVDLPTAEEIEKRYELV